MQAHLHDLRRADEVSLPGYCRASFGDIADSFDQLFEDFGELICLEAKSFDTILSTRGTHTVLDCACGTGMQAIGLAQLGYAVSASDISAKCLATVRSAAERLGLTINTKRADFRTLRPWRGMQFDAVIASGNSLPLVQQSEEVDQALASMHSVLKPGGCAIIGIRDYGTLRETRETQLPRRFTLRNGNPEWVMDLRLFGTERVRVITLFISAISGKWRLRSFVKSYLYISAEDVAKRMQKAGFPGVQLMDLSGCKPYSGGEWFLAVGEK